MGISAELIEHFFESEQRATGKDKRLFGVTQWHASIELQRADDHHITIIVIAIGGRPTGNTGVGGLTNDHAIRCHTGFEHVPKSHQRGGLKNGNSRPRAKSHASGKPSDRLRISHDPRAHVGFSQLGYPACCHCLSGVGVIVNDTPCSR